MRYTHFEIENFKGINKALMELDTGPRGNVFTLVGLNESGKTTVLEALNFLHQQTKQESLSLTGYAISDPHDLIPISKRYNFNGDISVRAHCKLDEQDESDIRHFAEKEAGVSLTKKVDSFQFTRRYCFENSKVLSDVPGQLMGIALHGKRKRAKTERRLSAEEEATKIIINFIVARMPAVLYFPNFLFEFPDKIYLENQAVEPEKHSFYQQVLQDVLDDMDERLDLSTHILARAQSGLSNDIRMLDSVLLKMSGHITDAIIARWNQIFKQEMGRKEINVTWGKDEKEHVYLQLRLRDGVEQYAISERSLGFRWFFAFLLLTQYRGSRKGAPKEVLFLLDEPASNLHPSAQAQLLESFGNFPRSSYILYTTHSHHMVNPNWLENTFVVKNEGLDYTSKDDSFSARNTVIKLERYRVFASQHPEQSTYFQPVLDVLDYKPSELENIPDVVMMEGKNDYYTLHYIQDVILRLKRPCNLLPGGGVSSLDAPIRLYLGWGRNFIVLLDSDKAGAKQKARYEKVFGNLVRGRIYTLADVDASWKDWSMEDLFTSAEKEAIQSSCYKTDKTFKFDKNLFNRALQESFLTGTVVSMSAATRKRFERLTAFLQKAVASNIS